MFFVNLKLNKNVVTNIVRIRRRVSGFDFSQQLPDIFWLVYDTNIKLASLGSAQLGLGSLRFILNIMASVERVVILLQGCIFDACGSYHITPSLYFREEEPRMIGRVAAVDPETLPVRAM